jgi:hypothetical protein
MAVEVPALENRSKDASVIDREPSPTECEWKQLTVVPEKQREFSADLYFRECWVDAVETFGDKVTGLLRGVAMLSVKPDAVVGRRMTAILEFLEKNEFVPIAVAQLGLTRHSMREVWRYDWHVYPVDRLAFTTIWYTACDVLMFLVRDRRPESPVPASVRLSQMKGHAIAERRKAGDLRSVLRPPNRILNFVHVAEEPVDVVREIGILTDGAGRKRLLQAVRDNYGADRGQETKDAIARLESAVPAHDLDVSLSLRRLEASAVISQAVSAHIKDLVASDRKLAWTSICKMIDPDDARVGRWDFICVASNLLRYERPVEAELLPPVSVARWMACNADR